MQNDLLAYWFLLKNRNFSLYTISYYLAQFGTMMTLFAIWSQVTALTGNDPKALGLATLLEIAPGIVIAPWAGLLADRFSKKKIMIVCFLLRALTVGLMFLSTELWHLYALAALHSTFGAFGDPPHRSFLPLLVKREQYVTMNAFIALLQNLLQFFRPALAGVVVYTFGYKTAFAIDFFTYFLPALALLFVHVEDQAEDRFQKNEQKVSAWQDVQSGVAYIRTEPILVYLFVFMMLLTLCMAMQGPLTFVFVGEHLATEEQASAMTGFLFSSLGIGGLFGVIVTPRLIRKVNILWLLFASLAFDGVVVVGFALSETVFWAVTCFALFGIIGSVNQIVQETLIQMIVPEHMRGRVYGAFAPITGPISLLSVGGGTTLAAAIGTRTVFLIAGLMEIGAVGICRILPTYRQVRESLEEKMGRCLRA